jgi:hypothetical protein
MAFSAPISAAGRALGFCLTATRLLARRYRRTGRHAMRGKAVRASVLALLARGDDPVCPDKWAT